MSPTMNHDEEEPLIQCGGEWVPAHEVWSKIETLQSVATAIERFNEEFPELSTLTTREVVPIVRDRLKKVQLRMPHRSTPANSQAIASALLQTLPPEDVITQLQQQHGIEIDLVQLIHLVGEHPYRSALEREAVELHQNRISAEQMAQLWNDSRRPAPGGGLWSAAKIEELLPEGFGAEAT